MARITKHTTLDSPASSSTLLKGEFGFDDYVAGGDQGRVYVGDGVANIALATKAEVDAASGGAATDIADLAAVTGTTTDERYDKLLSVRDVIAMDYTSGDLDFVRYEGDDDATVYYRDVMTYTDGNLSLVEHFYSTADLVTPSATTTLTYDGSDNLITSAYTEA
jgi:hypothetical protein